MRKVAHLPYEVSVILYITPEKVLALRSFNKIGTLEEVELPSVGEVMKGCRENKTNQVILVHNHPPIDGKYDTTPSEKDLIATKQFENDLKQAGIVLLDHIILAHDNYFSFRANGLM